MSRDAILRAVRAARPSAVPLPDVPPFDAQTEVNRRVAFERALEAAGGQLVVSTRDKVVRLVGELYLSAEVVLSAVPDVVPSLHPLEDAGEADLAAADLFVCEARFGVAENGAVWLTEEDLVHRAAPFLAQHAVVLLRPQTLVATMHDAYARIGDLSTGFGLFMAGPSKTADIEQSLVIGAHGPKSLTVVFVEA